MITMRRSMVSVPRVLSTAACLVTGVTIGCSDSGLKLADVSGVVTVDGKPMAYAGVVFHPEIGPIATGNTDAEGKFVMVTAGKKGASVGDHVVTISGATQTNVAYETAEGGTLGAPVRGGAKQKPQKRFSTHYASKQTSDLRVAVEAGEKNEFVFELRKEGAQR